MRLIDVDALKLTPDNLRKSGVVVVARRQNGKSMKTFLQIAQAMIDNAHTVDAVPVVHGRWLDCENYNDIRQCSECGLIRNIYKQEGWKYCPSCGAKMDAKEE